MFRLAMVLVAYRNGLIPECYIRRIRRRAKLTLPKIEIAIGGGARVRKRVARVRHRRRHADPSRHAHTRNQVDRLRAANVRVRDGRPKQRAHIMFRSSSGLRPARNQAETGFFDAGAETFISFIRLPPMIFALSSSLKSASSSTNVIGSFRPSVRPVGSEDHPVGAHHVDDLGEPVFPERADVDAPLERLDRVLGERLRHLLVDALEAPEQGRHPVRAVLDGQYPQVRVAGQRAMADQGTERILDGAMAHGQAAEGGRLERQELVARLPDVEQFG